MTPSELRAAGVTDVGRKRSSNEDRLFVDAARGVFVVVDGVGGHAAGETAADTAISVLARALTRDTEPAAARLRHAITDANNEIHRLAGTRPEWHGMACVLTAAVVSGPRVAVGHVGDSRLYRLLDGRLEKVTPDHSPVGVREDARELSEFEAMRHPRRNEVFRDVGSEPHASTDGDFVFVTEVDYPEGAALLLCSDGLTDLVPSETIRQIALTHSGAPEAVARALVAAANEAGGKDNVTVIYVERGDPGARSRARAPRTQDAADRFVAPSAPAAAPRSGRSHRVLTVLVAGLAGLAAGILGARSGWLPGGAAAVFAPATPAVVVVRASESIAAALAQAAPGTSVIVEPGEYRERLVLRDNVRVISREPRAATLRLPAAASEGDAAVVAVGISHAELTGFRIVGDASTPLGVGVIVRNASVPLSDLEISGATSAAVDLGPGEGTTLAGSRIHQNPGAAVIVRSGATGRIAHSVFRANASLSPAVPVVLEAGAGVEWRDNVFEGTASVVLAHVTAGERERLTQTNWFIAPPQPAAAPGSRRTAPAGRGGRAR